ncbi:amino acid permease [Methanolobus profundi]|uniref:Amino acid transporter n=1 Tax=Methanolobus profundi TaxID=487685 RepID=A0A1I4UQ75_9EURY|nr:amino acid permease [Methanolobus profundi]SFM91122.1 amino acid transporter [Methanolobus profundi]
MTVLFYLSVSADNGIRVSLSRDLTLFDITMIGIAGMIGAGIFALTGIATGIAGPAVILAFLLNGIVATFTGLAYAELGSAIPEAGGSYLWVKEGIGNHFGFLAGWVDWAAHTIACSLYAVTFGAFFSELVIHFLGYDGISQGTLISTSAFGIVTLMAYLNYLGAKESGRIGGMVTLFKVAILVVFACFGIYRTFLTPDWSVAFLAEPSFLPHGVGGLLVAMGLTFIAFEGYEIIAQSGEEVKDPEKNIPRAILLSLWIAVIIYIMVAFALIGAIKVDGPSWIYLGELGEFSMIRVAGQIMSFGSVLILAGGFVSTISAMNATVYSSSRVAFALGRMGYLPEALSNINEKRRTPHYAILFSYFIIATMTFAPIETVASAANVMFLILFILVNSVLIILRFRRPDLKRAFKMPFAPYLPILAIIVQLVIGYYLVTAIEDTTFIAGITIFWILAGSFFYFSYSEKEIKRRAKYLRKKVYEEKPFAEKGYKILVPIKNMATTGDLAKFANIVARERNGHIVFLKVLTFPEQTPLSASDAYVDERRAMMRGLISSVDVPSGGIIKVGRDASDSILDTIEEEKPDMVIMGWRGRTFRRDFVLGSTLDPLLLKAPCDVVVARFEPGRSLKDIRSILLPTAGGPHAALAAELAHDLAVEKNATVTMFNVGRSTGDEGKALAAFRDLEGYFKDVDINKKFTVSENIEKGLSEEAKKQDVVFIGATTRPFLKNFLMGVFPEKIIKNTDTTVIMARKWVKLRDVIKK